MNLERYEMCILFKNEDGPSATIFDCDGIIWYAVPILRHNF